MRATGGLTAAMAAAALLLAGPARAQHFSLGGSATVYNLAGEVRVEPGTGGEVTVDVTRSGDDAGALRVRQSGGTLAVVYPDGPIVYPSLGSGTNTSINVRPDGTFGNGDGFGGGRRITVRGSGGGTRAWADVRVSVPEGRTVTVHLAAGTINATNVHGDLHLRGHAASIHTQATRGVLDLDTGSGGITVSDADGEVTLDTGSGSVRLSEVRGPRVSVDTGSGGVTGEGVRADALKVDVGSGGVRMQGVSARRVEIDTGSGSVGLGLAADVEYTKIDTGSGGVRLELPESFGAQLDIDTGSGGIHMDVPATARSASRTHFAGSMGDGNGRVIIDTGSGGVTLTRG